MLRRVLPLLVTTLLLVLLAPFAWGGAATAAPVPDGELTAPVGSLSPTAHVTLTLLHNNDGESSLLPIDFVVPPGSGYSNPSTVTLPVGSVAAFKTLTDLQIADAQSSGNAVVNVYAGDAFLPSATLNCSLPPAPPSTPVYDAVAQRQIAYDAHIFGNHEFDFGPGFLLRFINNFDAGSGVDQPFLSANLDFSGATGYSGLIDPDGLIMGMTTNGEVIARSMIMTDTLTGGVFGIVGATTPNLPSISSPGDVVVTTTNITDTAAVVQTEIDRLVTTHGVNKILLVSHLQNIDNDQQMVGLLRHVDIAVAGGGDEFLANPSIPILDQQLPGESAPVEGDYPLTVTDADSRTVYIVTTAGNYKYLGRLDVQFDAAGEVSSVISGESYPRRVIPDSPEATTVGVASVTPDAGIVSSVQTPVEACLAGFASTQVGASEVRLDVSRDGVRGGESNAGDLISDSFIHVYGLYGPTTTQPVVAVQNGGGIRQNAGDVIPTDPTLPAAISRQNTIDVLPFSNFVTAIQNFTPAEFKAILEHSAEPLPGQSGRFLQIGGFDVTYNISATVGSRVQTLTLDDGTPIVTNGAIAAGAPDVTIVTNSFVADGGDGYQTFADHDPADKFNLLDDQGTALSYERALLEYLASFPVDFMGLPTIQDSDPRYAFPDGEGRITIVTSPPTAIELGELDAQGAAPSPWLAATALVALAAAAVVARRRRPA